MKKILSVFVVLAMLLTVFGALADPVDLNSFTLEEVRNLKMILNLTDIQVLEII